MSSRVTLIWILIVGICAGAALWPLWDTQSMLPEILNQARLQITLLYCVLFGIILARKEFILIVPMAAVLAFNLYWMSSAYPTLTSSSSRIASGQPLRLFSQNTFEGNQDIAPVVESIRQSNPDVVLLIEVRAPKYKKLVSELESEFPYHDRQSRHYIKPGLAIFSKYPLESRVDTLPVDPRLPSLKSRVHFQNQMIDVIGIHLESPHRDESIHTRNKQISKMTKLIKAQEASGVPLLLVGDMNTTPWNNRFRTFQQTAGLNHTGNFWHLNNSWPTWLPVAFGFSIDHVMMNNQFCSAQRYRIPTKGSDHFAFVSDLELCS